MPSPWQFDAVCMVLAATATLASPWPSKFVQNPAFRASEGGRSLEGQTATCNAVALRLMPTPAFKQYDECFNRKLLANSTHDWSTPGAEVAAQIDCWCDHNLTDTIQEYGCCEHNDTYPMCSIDCLPDCSSPVAQECIQECPAMCFELAEYMLDAAFCAGCHWEKCWPAVKCITGHAEVRTENDDQSCNKAEFTSGPEVAAYMQCWELIPKHTSHWNILSSMVHCICREGMIKKTQDTNCCDSKLYGGGVCSLQCASEQECATQEAMTCVHDCQAKCPAYELTPSGECMAQCLRKRSPCRKYVGCRPPTVDRYICDDGKWPEDSSGCCRSNETNSLGCPHLCETQRVWRLDRTQAIPWWSRWHQGDGIVAQCACMGCPDSLIGRQDKLSKTVSESIWENGQVMLVDIARREGLRLGPNRRMQKLMLQRNAEIADAIQKLGDTSQADQRIAQINDHFAALIKDAARQGRDRPGPQGGGRRGRGGRTGVIVAVVVSCSVAVLAGIGAATWFLRRRMKRDSPTFQLQQTPDVVIGSPVLDGPDVGPSVSSGAPVMATACVAGGGSPNAATKEVH